MLFWETSVIIWIIKTQRRFEILNFQKNWHSSQFDWKSSILLNVEYDINKLSAFPSVKLCTTVWVFNKWMMKNSRIIFSLHLLMSNIWEYHFWTFFGLHVWVVLCDFCYSQYCCIIILENQWEFWICNFFYYSCRHTLKLTLYI